MYEGPVTGFSSCTGPSLLISPILVRVHTRNWRSSFSSGFRVRQVYGECQLIFKSTQPESRMRPDASQLFSNFIHPSIYGSQVSGYSCRFGCRFHSRLRQPRAILAQRKCFRRRCSQRSCRMQVPSRTEQDSRGQTKGAYYQLHGGEGVQVALKLRSLEGSLEADGNVHVPYWAGISCEPKRLQRTHSYESGTAKTELKSSRTGTATSSFEAAVFGG